MISFNFAEKNSYKNFGIIISKRPNLPSPKRRVSYIDIPGRDSSLTYDERTYENITIGVECKVKDENLLDKIDEIKAWLLSAGEGNLIFSFNDNKKYKAQVVNSIDFSQIAKKFSEFIIVFNCRPFKYASINNNIILNQSGTSIINPGSIYSKPIIRVTCNEDGEFKINENKIEIIDFTGTLIIDSELEEAFSYREGEISNASNNISGEFPKLDVGDNLISFSGGISKIEITPNWRWL
ncbi:MAG: distal tail protein Dit [Miniphocaeibacter sp.]|uniref:distal tail protein Dit n=1 Tax=Miniphocaeibacter sp. TaxID=3100973 RepID=UPI001830AC4C|nr:phage tail protein [Gallicola sp.]